MRPFLGLCLLLGLLLACPSLSLAQANPTVPGGNTGEAITTPAVPGSNVYTAVGERIVNPEPVSYTQEACSDGSCATLTGRGSGIVLWGGGRWFPGKRVGRFFVNGGFFRRGC